MDVLELVAMGWRLVAMPRGSKNPGDELGSGWHSKATNDQAVVRRWYDRGLNFGVLLGSDSGVIDVEYDSEEGADILAGAAPTLSYRSAKSLHRIYRWDDRFAFEKAKLGHKGTEWRFGQNVAQSVIPPSLHESGARYEWFDLLPIARLPDEMWQLYQDLKAESEKHTANQRPVSVAPRDRTGDSLIDLARCEAEKQSWESLLSSKGWTFVRNRGDAQDWWRPGKSKGSISGTVNFGGTGTLRVFSTSCSPLAEESSYDKFAFICAMDFGDDPVATAKTILPQSVQDELKRKWMDQQRENQKLVDLSQFMVDRDPATDDEEFCRSIMPDSGLIAQISEYASRSSYRPSPVFSLATAVSLCQTIFGRKAQSETGLRTNDYHLIIAPTCTGKDGPLDTMLEVLMAAGHSTLIMPGDQTGPSSMLDCLEMHPQHIQNWVCDEFGYVLAAVLDKKSKDVSKKGIAKKLLELYGKSKSSYTGGGYSGKIVKHAMHQPHLCALGVSTGFTVFREVSEDQVHDGLLGRVSFWNMQNRPKANRDISKVIGDELTACVKSWIEFEPSSKTNLSPSPVAVPFSDAARLRWQGHEEAIDLHSESERAIRAAMWGRTAARSMKLALTHRLSRLSGPHEISTAQVELEDVNWGILLSNHCTRLACSMLGETVADTSGNRLAGRVLAIVRSADGGISKAGLNDRLKSSDAGSIWAAVLELVSSKILMTWTEPTKGRPKVMVGVAKGDNLA